MQSYTATVEVASKPKITPELVDQLMGALEAYHPAVGTSVRGCLEATITLPAESLAQATTTAAAVVGQATGAEPLAIAAMPTNEWDAREGFQPLPELVSVTEAAGLLGVSRQAVLDRIRRGTLQASRVGKDYAIPRAQLTTG